MAGARQRSGLLLPLDPSARREDQGRDHSLPLRRTTSCAACAVAPTGNFSFEPAVSRSGSPQPQFPGDIESGSVLSIREADGERTHFDR